MADREMLLMSRVAGAVLLLFGAGLVSLSIFMLWRQLSLLGHVEQGAAIFVATASVIALFCLTAGYRLATNRPNEYGSALPPRGWFVIALVFASAAAAFLFHDPQKEEMAVAGISAAILSFQCFRVGRAAQARKDHTGPGVPTTRK